MRELDPFSFFINHASAISGFGGENMSPDPRYCFHTPYVDVKPGAACYELQLRGVRASRGELALRVHAFRPDSGENASLVAGARLDVSTDEKRDLTISVRFAALRGVQYAFYGYFIEDSDLHAEGLKVLLHEPEGEGEEYVEPPRSILALEFGPQEVRPANALFHVVTPHLSAPVSQDCTQAQLGELAAGQVAGIPVNDWGEAICLSALPAYGVTTPALEGLVVGPTSADFDKVLADAGFLVRHCDTVPPPLPDSALFADFLVWPEGLWLEENPETRWGTVQAWLRRLKIGGLGVVTLRYRPHVGPVGASFAVDGPEIGRNEIGKWALRLIAEGYSVAPLAFTPAEDLPFAQDGLARFALIVRRQ